jgi:hypothetical protein
MIALANFFEHCRVNVINRCDMILANHKSDNDINTNEAVDKILKMYVSSGKIYNTSVIYDESNYDLGAYHYHLSIKNGVVKSILYLPNKHRCYVLFLHEIGHMMYHKNNIENLGRVIGITNNDSEPVRYLKSIAGVRYDTEVAAWKIACPNYKDMLIPRLTLYSYRYLQLNSILALGATVTLVMLIFLAIIRCI